MDIPLELMTSDDRKERIAGLQKQLSRAWLQATVVETLAIFLPAILVIVLFLNGSISETALVPILIVLGALMAAFWIVFFLRKAQPLQREINDLTKLDGTPAS